VVVVDQVYQYRDNYIIIMNHLNVWAWLKKRARFYHSHRPIGSRQDHCKDVQDVVGNSSHSLCTVEINEQYRSTTSLKNLVDDADKKSYDPQRSYEQDEASLDDSLSTVKTSEFVLSSNSSRIHLIHEALEYERLIRTRRVDTRLKLG